MQDYSQLLSLLGTRLLLLSSLRFRAFLTLLFFRQFMIIRVPSRVLGLETRLKAKALASRKLKKGNPIEHQKSVSFLPYCCLLVSFYFLLPTKSMANPTSAIPMFENVNIGVGFKPDPKIVQGISGGAENAREIAGIPETANGPCVGFVGRSPSHTLVLTSDFNYLRLQVESPDDTTLVISGPGGTWCNDDYDRKNAGIAGQWLPGTYQIWVGSYQKDKYSPYRIRITQVD